MKIKSSSSSSSIPVIYQTATTCCADGTTYCQQTSITSKTATELNSCESSTESQHTRGCIATTTCFCPLNQSSDAFIERLLAALITIPLDIILKRQRVTSLQASQVIFSQASQFVYRQPIHQQQQPFRLKQYTLIQNQRQLISVVFVFNRTLINLIIAGISVIIIQIIYRSFY